MGLQDMCGLTYLFGVKGHGAWGRGRAAGEPALLPWLAVRMLSSGMCFPLVPDATLTGA